MTKVQTYRCDRCGKIFTKDESETQGKNLASKVMVEDHDLAWDLDVKDNTSDICGDCVSSFYDWRNHTEDVDAFMDSKAKDWEKEADA
jgi:hypothetical protein